MKAKLVAILFAIIVVASCTTKGATVYLPATTVATSPNTKVTPTMAPKVATTVAKGYSADVYILSIQSKYPAEATILGRVPLIKLGNQICNAIDEGTTMAGFAAMAVAAGLDAALFGHIIGSAVPTFCPENLWFVQ